ncbi:T9SS type B sorting domain-containing protein [Aegicerativicinus sediminis]|uniref:T9SS type B sorting domain-containing protein n=1 Tax=Aegicerativicinus sediminis TaxID=2893202 RepID=UPI001E3C149B|nr:T9SS type B sorting domain-containing protein [Aegicerativicinus sediminis]
MRILSPYIIYLTIVLLGYGVYGQSPIVTASGNQLYCPTSSIPIVVAFNIENPANAPIDQVYIQISEGYVSANDKLQLINSNPNISWNWDSTTGKLRLSKSSSGSLNDLINAVKNVVFQNNNPNFSGKRVFSITTGQANYLASTDHYYEYVPYTGITWKQAKAAAEARTYYGLQGYLATLTSAEEAQLCGEQADGAGWIGGTDEDSEGIWKWVTGPEGLAGGLVFWNGGSNGSTPNFAFWNYNQPDNAHGGPGEDYAHITDPSIGMRGAWNDLREAGDPPDVWEYHPKGYIVEYGGMPGDPEIKISATTEISVATITYVESDFTCGPGSVALRANSDSGRIYWFTSETSVNPIHEGPNYSPTISSTTSYFVSAGPVNCYKGPRQRITATYYDQIDFNPEVTLTECGTENFSGIQTAFYLEEAIPLIANNSSYTVTFYNSLDQAYSGIEPLDSNLVSSSSSTTVFARIENDTPCYGVAKINLNVSTTSLPMGYKHTLKNCDDDGTADGKYIFDLTEAELSFLELLPSDSNFEFTYYRNVEDAVFKINSITQSQNYENEVPWNQELVVRIDNSSGNSCYSIGPYLDLVVNDLPELEISGTGKICTLQPSFTLDILNPNPNYSYEWLNSLNELISTSTSLTVMEPGLYSVQAISVNGCVSSLKEVEILASGPPVLTQNNIRITPTGNSYTLGLINLGQVGNGDYEFSLNNPSGPYQNEPEFRDVSPGTYTLFLNDKNGCGSTNLQVFLFGIPKFFTPNGDGHNDFWQIKGIPQQETFSYSIYDRYGKLLKKVNSVKSGWDGTYNGSLMPPGDYWFELILANSETYRGHFSLIL